MKKLPANPLKGPVTKTLWALTLPILVNNLVQIIYNVVDRFWVSLIDRSDPTNVGAVGLIFPIMILGMSVSNGLIVGLSSLVSRSIGAKDHETLNRVADSGLVLSTSVAVVMFIGVYIAAPSLVILFGGDGVLGTKATGFLYFLNPALVFLLLSSVLAGIFQGEGKMRHIMFGAGLGAILNMGMDPVFIFLLDMGVEGAALSTSVAQGVTFTFYLSVFLWRRRQKLAGLSRPDGQDYDTPVIRWNLAHATRGTMGKILQVGLPNTLAQALISGYFVFLNRFAVGFGEPVLTALTLYFTLQQVMLSPVFALSNSTITMVGQNFGARQYLRIRQTWRSALTIGFGFLAVLSILVFFTTPYFYRIFTEVPEVIEAGTRITPWLSLSLIAAVVGIIARSVFLGLGKALPAVIISLMRLYFFAIPALYLYRDVFYMGIDTLWMAVMTGNAMSMVVSFVWTQKRLAKVAREMAGEPEPIP